MISSYGENKKKEPPTKVLFSFKEVIIKIINSLIDNNYNTIVIILQDTSIFLQQNRRRFYENNRIRKIDSKVWRKHKIY